MSDSYKFDFGFLAIGDEITDGDIINSNTTNFAKYLIKHGFKIGRHVCCIDEVSEIQVCLGFLLKQHHNIIVTGGLGPTEDDLTTEAVAKYFDKELFLDTPSWQKLQQRMLNKYNKVPSGTKKQAMFPIDTKIINNDNGTANGYFLEFPHKRFVYVLPGPPNECIPMLRSINLNTKNKSSKNIIRKYWRVYNIGESLLADKLNVLKEEYPFLTLKYKISAGYVELKYFYPKDCPYSSEIITKIESILKDYLI